MLEARWLKEIAEYDLDQKEKNSKLKIFEKTIKEQYTGPQINNDNVSENYTIY